MSMNMNMATAITSTTNKLVIRRRFLSPRTQATLGGRESNTITQSKSNFNSNLNPNPNHDDGPLDKILLSLFRQKMVKEVGWNSEKPGYDGLIEIATCLMMKYKNFEHTQQATVRILRSLFPPFLLLLFRWLVAPLAGGKPAAIMTARVTAVTCQWLMGRCTVKSIELPNGSSCHSGVFVERCRYLEASKCAGICVHTCKLPTQTFIKEYMGIPLYMEPNFSDFSCQFKFGVEAPLEGDDKSILATCLEICPNNVKRKMLGILDSEQCPKI